MYEKYRKSAALFAALLPLLSQPLLAAVPPASLELLEPEKTATAGYKVDGGAEAKLNQADGKTELLLSFPAVNGYPSVDLPVPADGWDLSKFAGVQVEVTNRGTAATMVALRVDNAGDWRKKPWNTESVRLAPGETKAIKVTFGRSFGGGVGYALDASRISNLKLFVENPKNPVSLAVGKVQPFGTAGATTPAASPAPAATTGAATATGATVGAGGELLDFKTLTDGAVKSEGAEVQIIREPAAALKVAFQGGKGYPTVVLPVPAGGLDLSAFAGLQAEVTNDSAAPVVVAMRVDNAGDWKKSPWNTDQVSIPAGATRQVKVTFGRSYGNPGYALNAAAVSAVRVFAANPREAGALHIKSVKGFGTPGAAATPDAAPATTTASAAVPVGKTPPANGELLDFATLTDASVKTEGAAIELVKEPSAVKVNFQGGKGYPTAVFPVPYGGWNLSAYEGLQAEVTNQSPSPVVVAMRVDNAGDWKKSPWNTDQLTIPAGETRQVKVSFGRSYGNPGYALNAAAVTAVRVFAANPKDSGALLVKSVKGFGVAGKPAVASTGTGAAAGAAVAQAKSSPPISGELWTLTDKTDLGTFKTNQSEVSMTTVAGEPALQVVFQAGADYPNVGFPLPQGGWDLSSFGGVQVEVFNPGEKPVTAHMRVDNAGNWKESPWNTQSLKIPAKGTATLKMVFGENDGAPGYPLNSKAVSAMQLFLIKPKENVTLQLKNLKAYGSPKEGASALTTPADRDVPVTPAEWVGKRPPVEGDWVQTLNENFDGPKLNEDLWSYNTWWNGLLKGQTQRYSKDNVTLENGRLRIKTEKRTGHQNDDPSLPTREYTAGHIITYDKWTQAYGYFEARIKVPTARGLWPAFWMMPDRGKAAGPEGWKRESTKDGGMEIDILEHLTEWGPGRNNVAVHWDGYDKDHKAWGTSNIYYGPTKDGFHHWGLLWEPGKLTWYIDGIKKAEFANERVGTIPAYLLINVQMGSWATKDVDVSRLPDYMEVDWVRAWQLKSRIK